MEEALMSQNKRAKKEIENWYIARGFRKMSSRLWRLDGDWLHQVIVSIPLRPGLDNILNLGHYVGIPTCPINSVAALKDAILFMDIEPRYLFATQDFLEFRKSSYDLSSETEVLERQLKTILDLLEENYGKILDQQLTTVKVKEILSKSVGRVRLSKYASDWMEQNKTSDIARELQAFMNAQSRVN
jgi:hypothetical protein